MVFITVWVLTDLQLVSAEGDSDGAANQDYQTS